MQRSMYFVLAGMMYCTQLGGCFFIFIPGSVMSAAGDAITGSKGDHCVVETTKVGDRVRGPDGTTYEIKSLSGKSTRCTNAFQPVRAELVAVAPPPAPQPQ